MRSNYPIILIGGTVAALACMLWVMLPSNLDFARASEVSQKQAEKWMIDHGISGKASCNPSAPHYCDVVPTDARPPFTIHCGNSGCTLAR